MKYRVVYPLITDSAYQEFGTREEADKFAQTRRDICQNSPYLTARAWERVTVIEVDAS